MLPNVERQVDATRPAIDEDSDSEAIDDDSDSHDWWGSVSGPVNVVVDNRSPHDLEKVVVIHKWNGRTPPTEVLVWDTLPANQVSTNKTIFAKATSWYRPYFYSDWWQLSWRFKKVYTTMQNDTGVQKCPVCETEDGVCETNMMFPSKKVLQAVMDPRAYIRAGIYTGGVLVGAAIAASSMGAGTMLVAGAGAGISEGVLDSVQWGLLEDTDTSDFFMCGVKKKDIEYSKSYGYAIHLVITEEQDSKTGKMVPKITFETAQQNGDLITRRWCDAKVAQLPCEDNFDDEIKITNRKTVDVQVNNLNSVNITRLALVHKYAALGPNLLTWAGGIKVHESTDKKPVSTIANISLRSIGRSDWWMLAWQDEEDECLVKSTYDLDLMRDAYKGIYGGIFENKAFFSIDSIGLSFLPPEIGAPLSCLMNVANDLHRTRDAAVTGIASDLFGDELINTLSKSKQDKNGLFTRCNLKYDAVEKSALGEPGIVEIDRANNKVFFKFAKQECTADIVILRCVQSETCMAREDCKKLAAEGMKNVPPPTNVNAKGIAAGAVRGVVAVAKFT